MVGLVETIIDPPPPDCRRARTAADKTLLQRQIDATDRQIDQAVYELYGLTDKEIAIIEQAEKT